MSPLIRKLIQYYPEKANIFVAAMRNNKFVKIISEDGGSKIIGKNTSSPENAEPEDIVVIDLRA